MTSIVSKMYCVFCKNHGKDFKSHNLKNKEGIVICPEILNIECRYCREKGHTKNYCVVLQEKNKKKDEKYNKLFPPLSLKCKEEKDIYKDISIIFKDKLTLDEITKVITNYNLENLEKSY